jgi:hypothetical protein
MNCSILNKNTQPKLPKYKWSVSHKITSGTLYRRTTFRQFELFKVFKIKKIGFEVRGDRPNIDIIIGVKIEKIPFCIEQQKAD